MVVRTHTLLYIAHIVVSLSCACSGAKKAPVESEENSVFRDYLTHKRTPLEASTALREAKFQTCEDLTLVLLSLDARNKKEPFDGHTTLGLIAEALDASRPSCSKKDQKKSLFAKGESESEGLALSLIVADPQVALSKLAPLPDSAALLQRRATLHFDLKHHRQGRDALAASLVFEDDENTRVRVARMYTLDGEPEQALALCAGREGEAFALPRAGALAALGKYKEAIAQVDQSPLHLRNEVAEAAARHAMDPLAMASESLAGPEVLIALRLRLGPKLGDGGAALLERATLLRPDDGDLWSTLAEVYEATERAGEAVAAWDQAATYTPGSERPVLAPIRILQDLGRSKEAMGRAATLAKAVRPGPAASEDLRIASLAYRYAGDPTQALLYARRALQNRPGDGRLIFELSARLLDAEEGEEAARVLSDLLVCGARGQVWHRHEVAARLATVVGKEGMAAHIKQSQEGCETVDASDLRAHMQSAL